MKPTTKRTKGAAKSGPHHEALSVVGRVNGRRHQRQSAAARYEAVRLPRAQTNVEREAA
jgi:hypothetical protein